MGEYSKRRTTPLRAAMVGVLRSQRSIRYFFSNPMGERGALEVRQEGERIIEQGRMAPTPAAMDVPHRGEVTSARPPRAAAAHVRWLHAGAQESEGHR